MKKLLSLLGAIGLVATSSATVVSCGSGDKGGSNSGSDDHDKKDIKDVVKVTTLGYVRDNSIESVLAALGQPFENLGVSVLDSTNTKLENVTDTSATITVFDSYSLTGSVDVTFEIKELTKSTLPTFKSGATFATNAQYNFSHDETGWNRYFIGQTMQGVNSSFAMEYVNEYYRDGLFKSSYSENPVAFEDNFEYADNVESNSKSKFKNWVADTIKAQRGQGIVDFIKKYCDDNDIRFAGDEGDANAKQVADALQAEYPEFHYGEADVSFDLTIDENDTTLINWNDFTNDTYYSGYHMSDLFESGTINFSFHVNNK